MGIKAKDIRLGTSSVTCYLGNTLVWQTAWSTPTITLSDSTVSTDIVEGVTKYKVYDSGEYIGYVDSSNVWHGEVSG